MNRPKVVVMKHPKTLLGPTTPAESQNYVVSTNLGEYHVIDYHTRRIFEVRRHDRFIVPIFLVAVEIRNAITMS